MLKSALGILDKETKIEFMCWKVMKSGKSTCKKFTNCCFQYKATNFGYLN